MTCAKNSDGSTTHSGGGYVVTVSHDGAIRVVSGDSLSKYSMAIHGDFRHLHVFKHRRHQPAGAIADGDLKELPNVNLITVGELIYHMPSRNSSPVPSETNPPVGGSRLLPQRFAQMRTQYTARIWWPAYSEWLQAGQSWNSIDGRRTILSISTGTPAIIYLLEKRSSLNDGQIFIQSAEKWMADVRLSFVDEVAQRVKSLVPLIELEVAFLLGLVSMISWPGYLIVCTVGVIEFIHNNWIWLSHFTEAIRATYTAHRILNQEAPTLYRKLLHSTLHRLITEVPNVAGDLAHAIATNPNNAASAAGIIIGKISYKATRARVGVVGILFIMLCKLCGKAITALPQAIIITAQERAVAEWDIVSSLRAEGVDVTAAEAQAIIDEVLANPRLLQNTLEELERAFARL